MSHIPAFLILSGLLSMMAFSSHSQANAPGIQLATKTDCYASKPTNLGGTIPNTCDHSDATFGGWNPGQAPIFLYINLTGNYRINHIHMNTGYYSAFNLQTFDNGVWTTHATHTQTAFFVNNSVSFDTPTCASQFRIQFTSDTGSGGIDLYESWVFGTKDCNPACQLGSMGTTLEKLIPILVSAGLIVFGLGFFFLANESKGKGGKGLPLELLIVGAIGIVIAIAVAAGTVASMKVC